MAIEHLGQFDDVSKLLTEVHQQHCKLLSQEVQHADNQRYKDVDEMVFLFKQRRYNWLKRMRAIKIRHINLQPSQKALADNQKQSQHYH